MSVKNGTVKKIFHAAIIVVISVAMSLLFSACAPKGDGEEHTHEYVNYTYNNDATCVADGTETGKCKYCDKTDTRTKANTATGVHTFTDYTYNNDATCVTDGTETATCANCSATDTRTNAAHPATGVHTYDATDCCTVCGRQKPKGSEQCIHSYSNYVYNNDATCVTAGTETGRCKYCDKTDTRVSAAHPATGVHTFVNDVCTGCGEYNSNIVVTQGLEFTEITENNEVVGYELSGIGSVTDTEIVIPKTYNGKPVTSIGVVAFYDCDSLTSITMPSSVTSIGASSFSGCDSLTSVTIPDSMTNIGEGAFKECSNLTSIRFNNFASYCKISGLFDLDKKLVFIGSQKLYDMSSIAIPDSVTSIVEQAFRDCSNLTSITIPDSVTSIGGALFVGCSSLTNITVESENTKYRSSGHCLIETMTKTLIAGCKNSVIPTDGSVTSIGFGAFAGCDKLTSITIPDSVTSIGDGAFQICNSLTSITIPSSSMLSSIGELAFGSCSSLTSIIIPDSVTSIAAGAFLGCSSLTNITIPKNVTSIGGSAFYGCHNIIIIDNNVSYVDKWVIDCFYSETNVNLCANTVGIADGAFAGCDELTSITIPDSVTSIGRGVFTGCDKLTSIAVKNGNKKYHSSGNCLIETMTKTLIGGCKSCVIPTDGSVTSIARDTFRYCSGLTNLVIPDSVSNIGEYAFRDCNNLTSITIPNSVTNIGEHAFSGCSSLTIYCEAESEPSGWSSNWNPSNCPVVWDCKNK